jgi:hypothetical protein
VDIYYVVRFGDLRLAVVGQGKVWFFNFVVGFACLFIELT